MKARLAFHDKQVLPDGSIVEMKIWEVPKPVPGSSHRLKYSLFYGRGWSATTKNAAEVTTGTLATSRSHTRSARRNN